MLAHSITTCDCIDAKLLGGVLERKLQAWEKRKFGPMQHIHKMGLTIPEEDDLLYFNSCASGFWLTKLPYMSELDFFHVDQRPAASRRRMMKFYKECVRRQLYINGSERIHLSKNPTYCGRVEALIETFPDARFVVLYRNPYETIPSLLKLLHTGWKRRGSMEESRIRESTRVMTDLAYEHYLLPQQVLARHPATRVAEIDYRELTAQPRPTIAKAYAALHWMICEKPGGDLHTLVAASADVLSLFDGESGSILAATGYVGQFPEIGSRISAARSAGTSWTIASGTEAALYRFRLHLDDVIFANSFETP